MVEMMFCLSAEVILPIEVFSLPGYRLRIACSLENHKQIHQVHSWMPQPYTLKIAGTGLRYEDGYHLLYL